MSSTDAPAATPPVPLGGVLTDSCQLFGMACWLFAVIILALVVVVVAVIVCYCVRAKKKQRLQEEQEEERKKADAETTPAVTAADEKTGSRTSPEASLKKKDDSHMPFSLGSGGAVDEPTKKPSAWGKVRQSVATFAHSPDPRDIGKANLKRRGSFSAHASPPEGNFGRRASVGPGMLGHDANKRRGSFAGPGMLGHDANGRRGSVHSLKASPDEDAMPNPLLPRRGSVAANADG